MIRRNFFRKSKVFGQLENIVKNRSLINIGNSEIIKNLDNLLTDSVSRRMIADVPVGSFLSGGIDSSVVTAIMQKVSKRKVNTFSIGFREDSYDEANFAKKIAEKLGTNHTEVYLDSKEAQNVIPLIPSFMMSPLAIPLKFQHI